MIVGKDLQLDIMSEGQLFRDSEGRVILVDGIIASLFYAFDRYAEKTTINETMARSFGFEALKNSRILLYQAFSLADPSGKISDKRTEETLLKDLWEKITKIDMSGHGNVKVCMPYNFTIPRFVGDAEFAAETGRDTTNTLLVERMNAIEKRMEEKNNSMMSLLQSISSKVQVPPTASAVPPSFSNTYAGVTNTFSGRNQIQGRPQLLAGGSTHGRERSPSVKRAGEEFNEPRKKRYTDKPAVIQGTRSNDRQRKMKSPPADIFVYGVPRGTTTEDIVEDLAESDIQVAPSDIILMSKGSPSVISYRISVKAEDLQKALDPTVWPLRVKVREFIHYRSRKGNQQENYQESGRHVRQSSRFGSSQNTFEKAQSRPVEHNNVFSVLGNDVPA